MKFVARNQSAKPLQPSEQPLHDPAALVAAQGSAVLCLAAVLSVRRDHLDAVFLVEVPVQRVGVIRLVANQPRRQFVEEARQERFVDEFGLMRRGRVDRDGQGMGTRQAQEKQEEIWIASVELARSPGHPFYQRLKDVLDGARFEDASSNGCVAGSWRKRCGCWPRSCTRKVSRT